MKLSCIPVITVGLSMLVPSTFAQERAEQKLEPIQKQQPAKQAPAKPLMPRKDGLIPVNPKQTVLIDRQRKRVLVKAKICNREALLEMLVCLKGRKQHEAIVALDANAIQLHAALLAIGAKPGAPVKFVPKYVPSWGQVLDVFVSWKDKDGKLQRRAAQELIRRSINRYHMQKLESLPDGVKVPFDELRYDSRRKELLWFGPMTDKQYKSLTELSSDTAYRKAINAFREAGKTRPMKAKFIFSGSFFFEEPDQKKYYTAEGGWVVCVANLPEALIDVNIPSTDSDGNQAFEAWTDRIPAVGTEVTLEIIPRDEFKPEPPEAKAAKGTKKSPPVGSKPAQKIESGND